MPQAQHKGVKGEEAQRKGVEGEEDYSIHGHFF